MTSRSGQLRGRATHKVLGLRGIAVLTAVVLVAGCQAPLLEIVAVNADDEPYLIQDSEGVDHRTPRQAWLLPAGESRRLEANTLRLFVVSSDCQIRETISVYKHTKLDVAISPAGEISLATVTGPQQREGIPSATSAEPCPQPTVP